MKTKILAIAVCSLALSACDFDKKPDTAPDQGGVVTQPGSAPMTPASPPGAGADRSSPPAGGGSSTGASTTQ